MVNVRDCVEDQSQDKPVVPFPGSGTVPMVAEATPEISQTRQCLVVARTSFSVLLGRRIRLWILSSL